MRDSSHSPQLVIARIINFIAQRCGKDRYFNDLLVEGTMVAKQLIANHSDLQHLHREKVPLENLLLDPKNPRFEVSARVQEDKFSDDEVQNRAKEKLDEIGFDDLTASIRTYGFVATDPIVVRQVGNSKDYVVLEGNRRVAALKHLAAGHASGEGVLDPHVVNSIKNLEVLVYKGKDPNIAWILQGLRHMTGIKQWAPLQQAGFVARIEKDVNGGKKGKFGGIASVAKAAGVSVSRATLLLHSLAGYKQALADNEYGNAPDLPDKFAVFAEGIFRAEPVQKWLGWDENSRSFKNVKNLKKLLSWVLKNDDGEVRIKRAIDVRDVLADLVEDPALLNRFANGADIDDVRARLEQKAALRVDVASVLRDLQDAQSTVERLPVLAIRKKMKAADFVALLKELKDSAEEQIKSLNSK